MSAVLSQIPEIFDQERFNLERWSEIAADPFLASLEHRIETNEYGQIVMMPPPGFEHSRLQTRVLTRLMNLMPLGGEVLAECPVSTTGGVKGVDVVWISEGRAKGVRQNVLTIAPEICIEILSPANTRAEIEEKRRLYFEAGAEEVWIVAAGGEVAFFGKEGELPASALCPEFPSPVQA